MATCVLHQECPLCFNKGPFEDWVALKDALITLTTRSFDCPLCLSNIEGLDKYTLHLVSHDTRRSPKHVFSSSSVVFKCEESLFQTAQQVLNERILDHPVLPSPPPYVEPVDTKQTDLENNAPTISIREAPPPPTTTTTSANNGQLDTLDELLEDFSEFVRQESTKKTTTTTGFEIEQETSSNKIHPQQKCGPIVPTQNAHNLQENLGWQQQDQHLISPPATPHIDLSHVLPVQQLESPSISGEDKKCQKLNRESSSTKLESSQNSGSESPPSQVQCVLCGWNFDNDNFLQLHMVLMHSRRSQTSLQRRMKRVVEEYRCRECTDTSFTGYEDYVNHLKVTHDDQRFVCHICAKIFKLRGSLLVHMRVVHNPLGDGAHHCKVCNRKFTNKYRRDVHEKRHSDSREFECLKCGMAFEEKGEFEIHTETHKTEHKCNICGRTFYTQAALIVHTVGHQQAETEIEPENPPPPQPTFLLEIPPSVVKKEMVGGVGFKCHVCEKTFKRESHLNQHVKVHDNKQWECDVCKKIFTTKYFLKKHKRLHTGETPYACNICGKSFTFQQSYHKHMLYHTDEKPYSCSQCGRAFKELSTLQNHERIHSGERPFACETCGKSFRQRVSYLVHRRIHTGVMPYACNACGKSFRYKVTQRTHKCVAKSEDVVNFQQSILNPLAEDNAVAANNNMEIFPNLPQQIKQDLLNFRRTQGRRLLQGKLHNYLQKTKDQKSKEEQHSPVGQLEQLTLSDGMFSLSYPTATATVTSETGPSSTVTSQHQEHPDIKTEIGVQIEPLDFQPFA